MRPTVYTWLMSLIWCGVFVILAALLLRKKGFACKYGIRPIMLLLTLGIVRLFTPIELPISMLILSDTVMPAIQNFFRIGLFSVRAVEITVGNVLLLVWGFVSLTLLVKLAFEILLQYRSVKKLTIVRDPRAAKVMEKIVLETRPRQRYNLIVSTEATYPMVTGFFTPTVILPVLLLSEEALGHILRHEWNHFLHHDIWRKLLTRIICAVFWWNPLIHLLRRELDYALEVERDIQTTRDFGEQERIRYVSSTVEVIKQSGIAPVCEPATSGLVSGMKRDRLCSRLALVLSPPKRSRKLERLVLALTVLLLFLSYIPLLQPETAAPIDEKELFITPETAYIQDNGDGTYTLVIEDTYFMDLPRDMLDDAPHDLLEIVG